MTAFMYGLAQPHAPGQFAPKQLLGAGRRHGAVGQLVDGRQDLVGHRRRAGVHEQHAVRRRPTP